MGSCHAFIFPGFGVVKIFMDANVNETRSLNDSPNLGGIASSTSRRSVKYTNRRLLDGGKLFHFPRFLWMVVWFIRTGNNMKPDEWVSSETITVRWIYTWNIGLIAEICTKFDISIFQGPGSPLPNGIPTFSVQIFNLCTVGCPISDVHVACGWFASAKLVNPKVFRRVKFNDCLVNDGNPIPYGDSITFQYANSFAYQLRVETAVTCKWP